MSKSDFTNEKILTNLNVSRNRIVELEASNIKFREKLDIITSSTMYDLKNNINLYKNLKKKFI